MSCHPISFHTFPGPMSATIALFLCMCPIGPIEIITSCISRPRVGIRHPVLENHSWGSASENRPSRWWRATMCLTPASSIACSYIIIVGMTVLMVEKSAALVRLCRSCVRLGIVVKSTRHGGSKQPEASTLRSRAFPSAGASIVYVPRACGICHCQLPST